MLLAAQQGGDREFIFGCTSVGVLGFTQKPLCASEQIPNWNRFKKKKKAGRKAGRVSVGDSSLGEKSKRTPAADQQWFTVRMSFKVAEIPSACLNPIIQFLMFTHDFLTVSTHCNIYIYMEFLKAELMQITFFVFQFHNV